MRKLSFLFFTCLLTNSAFGIVHMKNVDPKLVIHQPLTNFDEISENNEALKMKLVNYLFDNDLIDHVGSKAYDVNAVFMVYYKQYAPLYRLIDLDHNGLPELVFNGYVSQDVEYDILEIFTVQNGIPYSILKEEGTLMAYKIQPNTKEILLYHHMYPCCQNASHNLNRLRLVNNKIQKMKRYFLGRDSGMVGPFLPKKAQLDKAYKETKDTLKLYWSPAIVEKNAWDQRSPINTIARFAPKSMYRVLFQEKNWQFVLMKSPPLLEKNRVINPVNFQDMSIYGWIQK